MKEIFRIIVSTATLFISMAVAQAQIVAWDFTSGTTPTVNQPGGTTALSFNTGGTVGTSGCTGNGYSSNNWNVGEYMQIVVPTSGYNITTLTFNLRSSNTGPANFKLQYSSSGTGGTFSDLSGGTFASTNAGSCAARSLDLSAVNALDNNANTVIRLVFTGGEADGSPASGDAAAGGAFRIDDLQLNGAAIGGSPVISVSPISLTGFSTTVGSSSTSQSYALSGNDLSPASGNITVTAPTDFEVSTNNSTFSSNLNVAYTGGTLASTTIYVRISASAGAGSPSGNVTNAGGGATTQNVAVDGTVCSSSATFSVGDISIVGYASDAPDAIAFVNWASIPNNSQLSFTDNAWTGSSLNSNEQTVVWENNTGGAIAPGTVIVITDPGSGNGVADLGTVLSGNLNGISASNDNIFVYEGTLACPNFIYGFSNAAWITTGTPNTNNTYLPAALNVSNGNLVSPSTLDNWEFSAPRNDQATIAAYKPIVNNASNWGGNDSPITLSSTDFTLASSPDVVVNPTALTGFATNSGTASTSQSYALSGSSLSPAAGNIVVTAPTDFEVSLNNSTFSNSLNVAYSGGSLSSTTVYVRIKASAAAGSPSGNVTNSGGGDSEDVTVSGTVCPSGSGVFAVGDVSIVGFASDAPDQMAFVTWVSIPNGTSLNFTDNAWTGSALNTNENNLIWQNNTGSAIAAGTVIVITDPGSGNGVADLGTVTSGNLNGISASNDNIFVYEGTLTCPIFIYGFSNDAWITTGTPNTNNSYLPTALNVSNGNLVTPSTLDNWEFSAPRNDQSSIAAYKPIVNNNANWTGNDSPITLSSTDFTIASSTPSVELSASAGSGSESAASVITITATASAAVTGNQTVTLNVSGSGITAGDYMLSNAGVITILNGQTTGSITFTIVDDAIYEGAETATLSFTGGSLSAGLIPGTTTSLNIGITDNDGATLYSQASGGTTSAIWDLVPSGTGQTAASLGGFSPNTNLVIQTGHTVDITTSGVDVNNLTVQVGAKLFANNTDMNGAEYMRLYGNVVNNGNVGNGSTPDNISFEFRGTNPITFSGVGFYNIGRMRKETGSTGTVTISSNMNLGFNGTCIYNNNSSSSTYDLIISAGKTVNVTSTTGDVAIDGANGVSGAERGGNIIVNGTLTVGNKIYAVASNSASFPCSIAVVAAGKIITKDIDVSINSGFTGINFTAGGTLEVNGTMAVTGGTVNAAGAVILNNGATLLHGTGTTGGGGSVTGNVIVKRQGTNANDVNNFWSTPVAGGTVPGADKYRFDPTLGNQDPSDDQDPDPGWVPFSGTMSVGAGYTSRGGGLASFTGNPNTGNVNVPLTYFAYSPGNASPGTPFNLVGNPYPGAISANALISANTDIFGSIYYWDDDLSGGTGYSVSDFAVWNGAGSVGGGGHTPNGYISSCQGFMVRALSGASVLNFTNAMRVNGNNSQFFRVDGEPSRMWLSLSGNDLYNEILVAMIDDATDGEDRLYDAVKLRGNTNISLTAMNDGWDYAIMAFAPVVSEKVVPLNVFVSQSGSYIFHSHTMENFDGYTVYLEDTRTSQWYPMVQGTEVSINLAEGDHSDRFFLHFGYVETTTGIDEVEANSLRVFSSNGQTAIGLTGTEPMKGLLEVISANGQMVAAPQQVTLGTTPTIIGTNGLANGVYVVRFSAGETVLTQRFVKM